MARSFKRQQKPRTRVVSVSGQPRVTPERQNFPIKLPILPLFSKRSIRTLMKRDVAKGITMPEANAMTDQPGIRSMGASVTRIVRQAPLTPPTTRRGRRTIKAPNPANGSIGRRLKDGQ